MHMRLFSMAAVLAVITADVARAEPWVDKMFAKRQHDFGTVARGADTVYRFEAKNIYKQDIELVGVRTSCGCTSPSIENRLLKTGDVGYVVAKFNTRTFTGYHGATLTVQVKWNDKGIQRRGETQLRVNGYIRGDVVFKPGAVRFDAVDLGTPATQKVAVTYAGRSSWKITDVRGANPHLEVEMKEKQRYSGRVAYDLMIRLKDSAPAGYFNEQLVLVTNDEQNPRIPIHVAGRVVPQISVAPEPLVLGEVVFGQRVTKKVIVRGKQPFRILSVKCDEDGFQFKTDDQSSERHVVEVVFDAKRDTGDVKQLIHIATDLGENSYATLTAYATVVPDESQPTTTSPGAAANRIDDGTAREASGTPGRVASQ